MQIEKLEILGAYIVKPKVFEDYRGYFMESYNKKALKDLGIEGDFVQDNISLSKEKGTLRGLHIQKGKDVQAKLVGCLQGEIYDVIVDVRENSPTYMQWLGVYLNDQEKQFLYVPAGLLHGYITLKESCKVLYKVDQYYAPASEQSVIYNDPNFGIDWIMKTPILSEKDRIAPFFKDSGIHWRES